MSSRQSEMGVMRTARLSFVTELVASVSFTTGSQLTNSTCRLQAGYTSPAHRPASDEMPTRLPCALSLKSPITQLGILRPIMLGHATVSENSILSELGGEVHKARLHVELCFATSTYLRQRVATKVRFNKLARSSSKKRNKRRAKTVRACRVSQHKSFFISTTAFRNLPIICSQSTER